MSEALGHLGNTTGNLVPSDAAGQRCSRVVKSLVLRVAGDENPQPRGSASPSGAGSKDDRVAANVRWGLPQSLTRCGHQHAVMQSSQGQH